MTTGSVAREKFFGVVDAFEEFTADQMNLPEATILDYGCGEGVMALGLAHRLSAKRVIGIDIGSEFESLARIAASELGIDTLPETLEFRQLDLTKGLDKTLKCDCVVTWSVFEHVSQELLAETAANIRNALVPGGLVFLQVSPLYYSAFGSHLAQIVELPWAHLLLQTNRLHEAMFTTPQGSVLERLEEDGLSWDGSHALRASIWDTFQTLNRATANSLIDLFEGTGFETIRERRTDCEPEPPAELTAVYHTSVLKTEQIVALFRKR